MQFVRNIFDKIKKAKKVSVIAQQSLLKTI